MHLQFLSTETQEQLLSAPREAYKLAVVLAAAYAIPRPAHQVESIEDEWTNVKATAGIIVGWFNEARPLDLNCAVDSVGQIWKALYETSTGNFADRVISANCVLDLFGIGYFVTPELKEELVKHAQDMGGILGACVKAARQMQLVSLDKEA